MVDRRLIFLAFILTLALTMLGPGVAEANSIASPDTEGDVGWYTSLALDGAGNPVVSYYDNTNGDLKILHCDDANCVGGGESITSPDTGGMVGQYTSLALDGAGNPVVSYFDFTNGDLKILHCDDANCVGGGESITSPDTAGIVGLISSLALDAAGNPVVSYYDYTNGDLKILHCDDANCAGGGESITSPDTAGDAGYYNSLVLDGAGNPVVSYHDATHGDLKILTCNDPNCAGGGESITSPDTAGNVGWYISLALDGAGNPVVSYWDFTNSDLKVLHCDDANCVGGGESITNPDTVGNVGYFTSLALDGAGNPVVSYWDFTNGDLKILHCDDANCTVGSESIFAVDREGYPGTYTSLALDGEGNPVVSYHDSTNQDLKVLHCNSPDCATVNGSISNPDTAGNVGTYTSQAMDAAGNPVVSYYDNTNGDLKVMHCNDPNCAGGGESITSPDTAGAVGQYTSLALDDDGYPVVSYYDYTNGDLKVIHCDDPNCAGGGESITSPDTAGDVGQYTSLTLDDDGYPVVGYLDVGNGDLKVMHCNDPNCDPTAGGSESIVSPDTVDNVGWYTSLALDGTGNPVVGYYDGINRDLKVMHCNDPNCDPTVGGAESITSPDTAGDVGQYTSLTLDGAGNPVLSYLDLSNRHLAIMHCNDPNCDPTVSGAESITSPDTVGSGGWYTSLALDDDGYPVVGYLDFSNFDLKVMRCNDPNCAGGDESIASADTAGDVGRHTALALDGDGYPVVSYYDATSDDLKILHCFNRGCSLNRAPEAEAGPDQTTVAGEEVLFTGSASDPDGDALTIRWDFGDGATADGTLTPQYAYAEAGVYTVTLTVTDNEGDAGSDSLTVTVEESAITLYLPVVLQP